MDLSDRLSGGTDEIYAAMKNAIKESINVVRIGFVGLGNMGWSHARQFSRLGHEVAAGADIDPKARTRFANAFAAKPYEDPERLLETTLDAVVVTTPPRFHESVAVPALRSGLDVFIEKPLAHDLDSAERIANAGRRSKGTCTVGFHNRFRNAVRTVASYRDKGWFGRLTHVEANYVRQQGTPVGSWMTDEELAGGGALTDIGPHTIDLALHLLNSFDVVEATGTTRPQRSTDLESSSENTTRTGSNSPNGSGVELSASAFLRLTGGRTVSTEVAWTANRDPSMEFIVRGTDGGAHFQLNDETVTLYGGRNAESDVTNRTSLEPNDPYRDQARAFVDRALGRRSAPVGTLEQALTVQRVIEAVYASGRNGRAVRLNEV